MFAAKQLPAIMHALLVSIAAFFFCLVVAQYNQFAPNYAYSCALLIFTFIIYYPVSKKAVTQLLQHFPTAKWLLLGVAIFIISIGYINYSWQLSLSIAVPLITGYFYLNPSNKFYLKKTWWAKPFAIAATWCICCIVIPQQMADLTMLRQPTMFLLHMATLIFTLSIAYDIVDIEKDTLLHYKTFATRLGTAPSTRIAFALLMINFLFAAIAFYSTPHLTFVLIYNAAIPVLVYVGLACPPRFYALFDLVFASYLVGLFFSI
ncbi:MAG: hypothetical protein IPO27_15155 [Bacteroidetes bacterium]|nr:hypothetical protein [Bacteroidota bacterium]